MTERVEKKFSKIYEHHEWGGTSLSGPGSDAEHNYVYLRLLQSIVDDPNLAINSVLDVGCGDWTIGRRIDWGSLSYVGMDIVSSVIENNQASFGSTNVSFKKGNLVDDDLPAADLLVIKDVLQHLSNKSIQSFLPKLETFKYALLTNDIRCLVSLRSIFSRLKIDTPRANKEISDGGWRPVSLRDSPFSIEATPYAYYEVPFDKGIFQLLFQKEILLWRNPDQ